MRIILNEKEILEAIEQDILANVNIPDDFRIDIDLKATRGEEGYQAFIDIVHENAPVGDRTVDDRVVATGDESLGIVRKINEAREAAKAPRRRGRPAGAKNKATIAREQGAEAVEADATDAGKTEVAAEPVATSTGEPIAETVVTETQDNAADVAEATEAAVPAEETNDVAEVEPEVETVNVDTVEAADTEVAVGQSEVTSVSAADAASEAVITTEEAQATAGIENATQPVAATVVESDVTEQATEELTANVSDAELTEETEVAPEAAPAAPVRSLFGNLNTPTNGG